MSLSGLVPLTLQATAQPAAVLAPSQATPKHATTGIQAIPSAVFGRILSFLPAQEKIRVHHVCQAWRNLSLVNDGCLDLSRLTNLSDRDLKTILDKASGTRITSINLSKCKKITDAGLAHLVTLTRLSSLNLRGCYNITDAGLAHLSKLTLLSSLNLWGCLSHITDAGLAHLSKLTLLSSLNLKWCFNITDAGLAHLSSLTSLTSLNLGGTFLNITDAGLAHLSKLTLLSSLNLSHCKNITDGGLAHLSKLTSLTSLNPSYCSAITDAGLAHLSSLTSLTSLDLNGCSNITDDGLAHLSELTSLTSLDLSACKNITDGGLAHLSKLTSLRLLDLSFSNITGAGLVYLSFLTSLTSLDLSACKNITDGGLAHLSKLTLLSSLNLRYCKYITDAGLAHLSKLTSLTSLNLDYSEISSDAVKAFKANLIPIECKDAAFRDRMDYYVYMLASQPKGGDEWGKKNRYRDLDRLRLAQALTILNMSRPGLFKELSIDPLLDLINQSNATNQHIDHLLNELTEETRNAIFGQVYQLAPHPKGGEKWGELHRFDNPARFRLAVMEVLKYRVLPNYSAKVEVPKEESCPICLDNFSDMNKRVTTACGHFFHDACLQPWLTLLRRQVKKVSAKSKHIIT